MKQQPTIILEHIREALWNNRACLFIGAGFTRNAVSEPGTNQVPLWPELGNLFFEKLNNRVPEPEDTAYLNIMKLAEDLENCFDRVTLCRIISDAIADDKRSPSELYYHMLSLPWQKVFTTNYDSLLERAARKSKRMDGLSYSTLIEENAISSIDVPYIAKLHGDLNNPMNMIITEEDYRTYPNKHKVFMTVMKNTLMTHTMVVIGFSCDDPNFIHWVGWLKDTLGSQAKSIYLISVNKISDIHAKALACKKITVVDISQFAGEESNPQKNLEAVFQFWDQSTRMTTEQIAFSKKAILWGKEDGISLRQEKDYMKLYKAWESARSCYPGWIVLPRDKREYILTRDRFDLSLNELNKLDSPYDLLFLNEFNWRIEKCLYPIQNEWEPMYLSVILRAMTNQFDSRDDVKEAINNLQLALLRLYRQENWELKWMELSHVLEGKVRILTEEQFARLKYEQCLYAVYHCDLHTLKIRLEEWTENIQEAPYWSMKKAALWAEYLSLEKGKYIAQKAFQEISSNYEMCSFKDKYFWASQKNAAHSIIHLMNIANLSSDKESNLRAQETWANSKNFDDIWYDRDFFNARLRHADDVFQISKKFAKFNLGVSKTTYFIEGNSKDYRIAYAFFNYYEELGYPIHLPYLNAIGKEALFNALSLMAHCSPAIAENWMMRTTDVEAVSYVFSRKRLSFLSADETNEKYQTYLSYLEQTVTVEGDNNKSWVSVMRRIIPEVLSRLCLKASYELRTRTLDIINKIYTSTNESAYKHMDELIDRLMTSFTTQEKTSLIPFLCEIAAMNDNNSDSYGLEVMSYVTDITEDIPFMVESEVIDKMLLLIEQDSPNRRNSVSCLTMLFKHGCLNQVQTEKFATALWRYTDKDGFPTNTIFSKFAFLSFPYPQDINPSELLRSYFRSHPIPYNKEKSIALFGNHEVVNNIKGTINDGISFEWYENDLALLIDSMRTAWEHDKQLTLKDKDSFGISVKDEYRSIFIDMGRIITDVLAKNKEKLSKQSLDSLREIIEDYPHYGLPNYSYKKAFSEWYDDNLLDEEFYNQISSNDNCYVTDCLVSLKKEIKQGLDVKKKVEYITENFRCNKKTGQSAVIDTISFILSKHPDQMSQRAVQNIVLGLNCLYNETEIEKTDMELQINEKLYLRKEVASIVASLISKEVTFLPEVLVKWKAYYEDKDTFLDVKREFVTSSITIL